MPGENKENEKMDEEALVNKLMNFGEVAKKFKILLEGITNTVQVLNERLSLLENRVSQVADEREKEIEKEKGKN